MDDVIYDVEVQYPIGISGGQCAVEDKGVVSLNAGQRVAASLTVDDVGAIIAKQVLTELIAGKVIAVVAPLRMVFIDSTWALPAMV
jgi:hypothetical protein